MESARFGSKENSASLAYSTPDKPDIGRLDGAIGNPGYVWPHSPAPTAVLHKLQTPLDAEKAQRSPHLMMSSETIRSGLGKPSSGFA